MQISMTVMQIHVNSQNIGANTMSKTQKKTFEIEPVQWLKRKKLFAELKKNIL